MHCARTIFETLNTQVIRDCGDIIFMRIVWLKVTLKRWHRYSLTRILLQIGKLTKLCYYPTYSQYQSFIFIFFDESLVLDVRSSGNELDSREFIFSRTTTSYPPHAQCGG